MESRKTEGREYNFGGPAAFTEYIDGGAGGWGGLSFYPETPLQHTSSFCKPFSVLRRCVCINVSSCQNVGEIVVMTKNTCYFALHRV